MEIIIKGLNKWYGKQQVLCDVNTSFSSGRIHGLIGRNGSGKTVLFRCIAGYTKPESGVVVIGGQQIGKDISYPKSLGLILEAPGFLPQFSGAFNLELLLSIKQKPDKKLIHQVLKTVGLEEAGRKAVGKYSMGMRQRLGIAQAIMEDPDLLILDEPFNGLDQQGVQDVHHLLRELRSKGKTILLTSHYAQDIEALCDTISRMETGRLSII